MLIIDDEDVFVTPISAATFKMGMVFWQVLMTVLKGLLIMARMPDPHAYQHRQSGQDSEPRESSSKTKIGTNPTCHWVGDQPAGMR